MLSVFSLLYAVAAVAVVPVAPVSAGAERYEYVDLYADGYEYTTTFSSKADFTERVLNSEELWLIQFYAPWDDYEFECETCQRFAPAFEEAARLLRGVAKFGVVDAATAGRFGRNVASRFVGRDRMDNIAGYPRVYAFGYDKHKPIEYNKGLAASLRRDDDDDDDEASKDGEKEGPVRPLVGFVLNQIGHLVTRRSAAGSANGDGAGSDELFNVRDTVEKHVNLIASTEETFRQNIVDHPINVIVFLATYDVYSESFLGEVVEASYVLQHLGVGLHVMDGGENPNLVKDFDLGAYPAVFLLSHAAKNSTAKGANDDDDDDDENAPAVDADGRLLFDMKEYEGALTTKEFVDFVYLQVDAHLEQRFSSTIDKLPPIRIMLPELDSPEMLRDTCTIPPAAEDEDDDDDGGRYCVLAVLPPKIGDDDETRRNHLVTLQKVKRRLRGTRTQFLWTERRAQPGLERALGIADDDDDDAKKAKAPAVYVLHLGKHQYLAQPPEKSKNAGFTVNGIVRFVKKVDNGQMRKKMKDLPGEKGAFPDVVVTLEKQQVDEKEKGVESIDETGASESDRDEL